jgi:hypothetical protein
MEASQMLGDEVRGKVALREMHSVDMQRLE